MTPIITKSLMSNRWYVVTRYKTLRDGRVVAREKYDVTERIEEIIHQQLAIERFLESKRQSSGGGR